MISSSTDPHGATEDRRRQNRLLWLLAILLVALLAPAGARTSALFTADASVTATVGMQAATPTATDVVTSWAPTTWWRADALPLTAPSTSTGYPAVDTSFLEAAGAAVRLHADSADTVRLAGLGVTDPTWSVVVWLQTDALTAGRLFQVTGVDGTGDPVTVDVTVDAAGVLTATATSLTAPPATLTATTPLTPGAGHLVALTGTATDLTLDVDAERVAAAPFPGLVPAEVPIGPLDQPGSSVLVDEVVVVDAALTRADLDAVRALAW